MIRKVDMYQCVCDGCGYYHKRDNTIWYESFKKVDKWAYFEDLVPFLEG